MRQHKLLELKSGRSLLRVIAIALIALWVLGSPVLAQETTPEMSSLPNVVLVHGAWADGSSWDAVIQRLQAAGYNVSAPQFPLTSLADDVARLQQVLVTETGPTIVVGHSYGGQIITA